MSKARELADLGSVTTRLDEVGNTDGALSNRNLIINGAMQVAQRGDFSSAATFTSGQYWLDRWIFDTNNANSLVSQVGVDVTELSSKTKAARVEAGTTGSSYLGIRQKLEFPENYAGKTYTFSAYVRSNNVNARLTGFFIGPNQVIASDAHTGDGSWQRLSVTFTFSTTAASAAYFDVFIASTGIGAVSTSAGDYMEITGVQLETGDTATPFEHRSYADELARCQRFYYKRTGSGRHATAGNGSIQQSFPTTYLPVPMRVQPSLSYSQVGDFKTEGLSGGSATTTAITFNAYADTAFTMNVICSGASSTSDGAQLIGTNGGASSFTAFDAEL